MGVIEDEKQKLIQTSWIVGDETTHLTRDQTALLLKGPSLSLFHNVAHYGVHHAIDH
jgi:hypothetical protein